MNVMMKRSFLIKESEIGLNDSLYEAEFSLLRQRRVQIGESPCDELVTSLKLDPELYTDPVIIDQFTGGNDMLFDFNMGTYRRLFLLVEDEEY